MQWLASWPAIQASVWVTGSIIRPSSLSDEYINHDLVVNVTLTHIY